MSTQAQLPPTQHSDSSGRKLFLIGSGLLVLAIGIAAPFVQWYLIMHATCGPSNGLCGLETGYTILLLTLPCLFVAPILILLGIMQKRVVSSSLYWPAVLSCCFSAIAIAAKIFARLSPFNTVITQVQYIINFTPLISSFVACGSAVVAVYLTRNIGWRQGRLLSVIALSCGFILIVLLCTN